VIGATIAVSMRRTQTFNTVLTVVVTVMMFLAGLMFPISAMPTWMAAMALANPLTYGLDAMRQTANESVAMNQQSPLSEPLKWGDWQVPISVELSLVAAVTLITFALATHRFSRVE